jgi:hypothetical protein
MLHSEGQIVSSASQVRQPSMTKIKRQLLLVLTSGQIKFNLIPIFIFYYIFISVSYLNISYYYFKNE